MRFFQAYAIFTLLSGISVNCVPIEPSDIHTVTEHATQHGENKRYQATEKVKLPITDEEIKSKNKAFHEAALQHHKDNGGQERWAPGMSAAQLHGDTLYHSTTARGTNNKPPLNSAYQGVQDDILAKTGKTCPHRANGKCAEGGTTSQVLSHTDNMAGQRISSYGTARRPDDRMVTGFHQGCAGNPEKGTTGCADMIKHNGLVDVNKLKPGRGQKFQDILDGFNHRSKPTIPSPHKEELEKLRQKGLVTQAVRAKQPGWTPPRRH